MTKIGLAVLLTLGFSVSAMAGAVKSENLSEDVNKILSSLDYQGKNGYSYLYVFASEAPLAQKDKILSEDVAIYNKFLKNFDSPRFNDYKLSKFKSLGKSYKEQKKYKWCSLGEDCLSLVRSDIETYKKTVKENSELLQRAEGLAEYDHFKSPFLADGVAPIPNYHAITLLNTKNAISFVNGDIDNALSGTCNIIKIGQALLSSDIMVGSMIGTEIIQEGSLLFSSMRSELPKEYKIPENCISVFNTKMNAGEYACRSMLAEGKMMMGLLLGEHSPIKDGFLFNSVKTANRMAPDYTRYCSSEIQNKIARDLPINQKAPVRSKSFECILNYKGCVVADIALPNYQNYVMRIQDSVYIFNVVAGLINSENYKAIDLKRGNVMEDKINIPLFMERKGKNYRAIYLPRS